MFSTPVLLVIFNRPHKTEKVMDVIRQLKPLHLYIAADGPRTDKPGEAAVCAQTREIALQGIDWPCELKTLFQTDNLGCGIGVATAISWFFEQVEEGIILEDDCLADQSFFEFCSVLLGRYRNNDKIMHIGGNNFQFGQTRGDGDYYYSLFSHNWGWASWKRAWKYYEYDIDNQKNTIQKIYRPQFKKNKAFLHFLDNRFNEVKMPQNHIWDIQWHFAIIKNKGISIIPNKNLVQNIGFGKDGTHTLEEEEWNKHNIAKKLNSFNSPSSLAIDHDADNLTMKELFKVEDKYNNFLSKKNEEKMLKKKKPFFIKKITKTLLSDFFLKWRKK